MRRFYVLTFVVLAAGFALQLKGQELPPEPALDSLGIPPSPDEVGKAKAAGAPAATAAPAKPGPKNYKKQLLDDEEELDADLQQFDREMGVNEAAPKPAPKAVPRPTREINMGLPPGPDEFDAPLQAPKPAKAQPRKTPVGKALPFPDSEPALGRELPRTKAAESIFGSDDPFSEPSGPLSVQPRSGGSIPAADGPIKVKPRITRVPTSPTRSPSAIPAAPSGASDDFSPRSTSKPLHYSADDALKPSSRQPSLGDSPIARGMSIGNGTGPQSQCLAIEWNKKTPILVGQEAEIDLIIRNTGTVTAQQILVDAVFPETVRVTNANPRPSASPDRLTWKIESMIAGAEQRFAIKLIPSRRGDISPAAHVRFAASASSTFAVEEPVLKLAITGPQQFMIGDAVVQTVTVSNPGTGVATDVKIQAVMSAGLQHPRGETLTMELGALNPGDSRMVRLALAAAKGGLQNIQVSATSSTDAAAEASVELAVLAPSLKVHINGPGLRYKGRSARYKIEVQNDGTVACNNVQATQKIPAGFKFVSASKGGQFMEDKRAVVWYVGGVEPKQTIELELELTAGDIGEFPQVVQVVSDGGIEATDRMETRVEGTPDLVLSLTDLDDPVELGVETGYDIKVRNEGSIAATNVSISCDIPVGVDVIDAKGPTAANGDRGKLTFRPIPSIGPGQEVVIRVRVRGVDEGSQRFRVKVSSDSIKEPLNAEEATKFYSDRRR